MSAVTSPAIRVGSARSANCMKNFSPWVKPPCEVLRAGTLERLGVVAVAPGECSVLFFAFFATITSTTTSATVQPAASNRPVR